MKLIRPKKVNCVVRSIFQLKKSILSKLGLHYLLVVWKLLSLETTITAKTTRTMTMMKPMTTMMMNVKTTTTTTTALLAFQTTARRRKIPWKKRWHCCKFCRIFAWNPFHAFPFICPFLCSLFGALPCTFFAVWS